MQQTLDSHIDTQISMICRTLLARIANPLMNVNYYHKIIHRMQNIVPCEIVSVLACVCTCWSLMASIQFDFAFIIGNSTPLQQA